jgi:hypothetical protein
VEITRVRLRSQAANILAVLNHAGFCNHGMRFLVSDKMGVLSSCFFTSNLYLGMETITKEKSAERFI